MLEPDRPQMTIQ